MKEDDFSYEDKLGLKLRLMRALWGIVYLLVFRFSPRVGFQWWRRFLLRSFGAKMGKQANVYPSAKIWAPWNLSMAEHSCLAEGVDCYNVGLIELGPYVTVSQRSFLCSASHDISLIRKPLTYSPIQINEHAWICAEAFVGPGVTVGEGAVLAARGVAVRDLDEWAVYGGNPAQMIKKRIISNDR